MLTAVMTAFAVGVFVYLLKLPFQLVPGGSTCLRTSRSGFAVAFSLQNLAYCLAGVALGTLIGVLPGITPLVAIGMLFPLTFTLPPIALAHHARRDLLRRAVRRLDHLDPRQPAGRDRLGGDLHRRLPDGAPGARGAGARDRRAGVVLRRLRRHPADRVRRAAARRMGAAVRPVGVLRADADGPGRLGGARAGRRGEGPRDGGARPAARHRRHRRQLGLAALHLRRARALRRHRLHGDRGRPVRGGGDRHQPRVARGARGVHRRRSRASCRAAPT